MVLESGDQCGVLLDPSLVILTGLPPLTDVTQMSVLLLFSAMSTTETTKATFVPSGEISGLDTLLIFVVSLGAIGFFFVDNALPIADCLKAAAI